MSTPTWMFFCGHEHQKLIWPFHKRVCGKNSNPFKWPALTDREIEEMVKLSTLKVLEVDGKGSQPKSWLDEFEEKIAKGEDCATVFKLAAQHLRDPECETTSNRANRVVYFRYYAVTVYHYSTINTPLIESVRTQQGLGRFFNHLVSTQLNADPTLVYEKENHRTWWTKFQHLFLIHRSIIFVPKQDPIPEWLTQSFYYTRDELKRFVDNVVAQTDPSLARTIVDHLIGTDEDLANVKTTLEKLSFEDEIRKALSRME